MTTHLSYDQLPAFCGLLAQRLKDYHVLTLTGSMGAGKTSLVKHLLAHYAVKEPIISPTYAYVVTYQTTHRRVYHFDLYRLKSLQEFLYLGFEEYFADQQALVIIEWPEIIEQFLDKYPKKYAIALEYYGIDKRLITQQLYFSSSDNT